MNFSCWASGTWAAGTWAVGSWCPGAEPEPQPDVSASMLAARMRMQRLWIEDEELIVL